LTNNLIYAIIRKLIISNLIKEGEKMQFHYTIMKTHSMLIRKISYRAQNELGLTSGQPKVLDCLLDYEGSDQKTIASVCEIEQATLGSILTRMEDKGLIERRKQVGNRRSLFVYFTEQGRDIAEKMRVIFEEEDKAATEILSDEECSYLNEMLEKICKKMVKDSEEKKLK
jgi:DNA-binding MarR family transcriptional regulator